jgi:hypothetical protein
MEKTKKIKRGYLLFAFGNKQLDYGKLAVCCALSIKTNLKYNHTTVVLDEGTKRWLNSSISKKILNAAFDKIIISKEKFHSGKRKHYDSPWVTFKSEFNNQNRVLAYEYSPYYETILIDVDYLVMSNSFDEVWKTREELLINHKVIDLQNHSLTSLKNKRLSTYGIPLYWATIVYFKKTPFTKTFFELVNYIREEYNFFQFLYGFTKGFYRNDFSFSIAAHILNGYKTDGILSFPEDEILFSFQKDGIAEVLDSKEIIFLSHDPEKEWENTLVKVKDVNVHIMNKRELLRVSDKFIKSCMEKL